MELLLYFLLLLLLAVEVVMVKVLVQEMEDLVVLAVVDNIRHQFQKQVEQELVGKEIPVEMDFNHLLVPLPAVEEVVALELLVEMRLAVPVVLVEMGQQYQFREQ
jgi:hypothetical protein